MAGAVLYRSMRDMVSGTYFYRQAIGRVAWQMNVAITRSIKTVVESC